MNSFSVSLIKFSGCIILIASVVIPMWIYGFVFFGVMFLCVLGCLVGGTMMDTSYPEIPSQEVREPDPRSRVVEADPK